ncbi:MAG: hypothetical protein JJU03_08970 [Idiomarina sp.]|nr:hypothetical protein [Idiomarina sp.]
MKPTILQRILFIFLLVGGLVLGVVVASGFLILALLLIPVVLVRFYLHKRTFEKAMAGRRAQRQQDNQQGFERSTRTSQSQVIEGEVVSKREDDARP